MRDTSIMMGCVPAGARLCVPLLHVRLHEASADMHYITDVVLHDIANLLRQQEGNDGSRKPGLTAFAALPIQVHFSDVLIAMRNACIYLDQRPLNLSSKSVSANIRARFRETSCSTKGVSYACTHVPKEFINGQDQAEKKVNRRILRVLADTHLLAGPGAPSFD